MSWSRRWTACADGGSAAPGAGSAPWLPCDEWACHLLCSCKESNQRNTPPSASRRSALLGPPRGGAELAALRHPRLFALAGPAVLGSLQGGPDSRSVDPYPHTASPANPPRPAHPRDLAPPAARGLSPLAATLSPLEQHQADRQRSHACNQAVHRFVTLGVALGRRQQFVQGQEHHHAGNQAEHPAERGVRQRPG